VLELAEEAPEGGGPIVELAVLGRVAGGSGGL
jgi:hypothetical protein